MTNSLFGIESPQSQLFWKIVKALHLWPHYNTTTNIEGHGIAFQYSSLCCVNWILARFYIEVVTTITYIVGWSWSLKVIQIIVGLRHLQTAHHNTQSYVSYIICYRTYGMRLWLYSPNVGHGHIFQKLELQQEWSLNIMTWAIHHSDTH
jgi:hypothetical protein